MNLARRSSSVRMGGPLIGCFTVAGAAAATASAPFLAAVPKTPANRVWAGDGVPALELLSHCGAASSAMRGVEAGLSTRRAAWSELGARLAIGWRDCDARCCPACDVRCGRRWGEGPPVSSLVATSLPACCIMLRKNASDWPMEADFAKIEKVAKTRNFIFA